MIVQPGQTWEYAGWRLAELVLVVLVVGEIDKGRWKCFVLADNRHGSRAGRFDWYRIEDPPTSWRRIA